MCFEDYKSRLIISHNVIYMVSHGPTLLNSENVNANKRPINDRTAGDLKFNDTSTRY